MEIHYPRVAGSRAEQLEGRLIANFSEESTPALTPDSIDTMLLAKGLEFRAGVVMASIS